MAKIDGFINQYSLSKTLRFKLIPVGDTLRNFNLNNMLAEDEKRAESYSKVKKIMDDYHRKYIEDILSSINSSPAFDSFLSELQLYSGLYYKMNKDDNEKQKMKKSEEHMRKILANAFTSTSTYKLLFKKEMIKEILPSYLDSINDDEGKKLVEEFNNFSTYFNGFFKNRENMYSEEEKSTAISYRCINDNLPKFLDNAKVFSSNKMNEKIFDDIKKLNEDFNGIYGTKVEDLFAVDYFINVLSQNDIEKYNSIIGGYTCSDGTKVQGLNEYINLYNQKVEKTNRIPKLKPLYKQILSNKGTISFIPEKFDSDDEVLSAISKFYAERQSEKVKSIEDTVSDIIKLFNNILEYDMNGIFIRNNLDLTEVCAGVFKYWGTVQNAWNNEYDASKNGKNTGSEKYLDTRKKLYKAVESFSIADIQRYGDSLCEEGENKCVAEWIKNEIIQKCADLADEYDKVNKLISVPYVQAKRLYNNDEATEIIKDALDSVKNLEHMLKILLGTGKEVNKDESFYGELVESFNRIQEIDELYDKVRNYMTQKPFKTDKIKLNFQNPQFLGGWDRNKETACSAVILRKNDNYFLAVMPKNYKKTFENIPCVRENEDKYEKVVYKLLPGPEKMLPKVFFSKKNISDYNPSKQILEKYNLGTHKSGENFNIDDCHNLIDFFKSSIRIHPDWCQFDFNFSDTSTYTNIGEFYNEVKNQGYKITFCDVPVSYIDTLVGEGKLYLFQIYNKDFSKNKKANGTPNLHTLYFRQLFSEENLENVVLKLNGESEMFYRKASINKNNIISHPKNQYIKNKNQDNGKKESVFEYDLIKDKRYTVDQFLVHIPITLNFTADGRTNINLETKIALKECDDNYVIGIDRGERNLLYVCVINSCGEIVKQFSLNEIINEYNGKLYKTDYHNLLEKREKERKQARESWKSIENIKELKEGYIGQVVHKICQLVEEYDAIIVMEDLNFGFKRVRGGKFEKSVYQKFEKMLIDKLNFYADKKKDPSEIGSVIHAYQLTNKFDSFKTMGKQNGFIFYVPAYFTSKIDPTTGFADLLHPHYTSIDSSKDFINKIDDISYNKTENYYEFMIDYDNFPKCNSDFKKKWTICSYGNRIKTYRNPDRNNEWDNLEVNLTEEFTKLFSKYDIDIYNNLKDQILLQSKKEFFKEFMFLFKLTLQLRNSETGNVDQDYLISPVKNADGKFYNSNEYKYSENAELPRDADANGAYNIARKGLWAISQIKACNNKDELKKVNLAISNKEWLEFAQKS